MQEVFEKIIEGIKTDFSVKLYGSRNSGNYMIPVEKAIEIVKQIAAEYDECYKDCGECEGYNKEKHHCPKFCKVITDAVKEIEENHNGWIPCSERLPDKNGSYITTSRIYYTPDHVNEPDNYIGIKISLYTKKFGWHDEEVFAWQPLPEPYQPKGE